MSSLSNPVSPADLSQRASPVIAVLAFDRISPFHLSVPCVVFGDRHPEVPVFDFRVCAAESGPLRTTAGFALSTDWGLEGLAAADIIIIPSWRNVDEAPPAPLLAALQAAHAHGALLVGLCLGAYVLAEAGVLDGQRATTHWAYAEDFARRYPQVQVDANVLYLHSGTLVTSAGTAAAIDCCLYLLRQLCGARIANRVARRLVMPPYRQGGQAQYIEQPIPATPQDARLARLIDWVRAHLAETHTLDSLAVQAHMSRRTLTRHFRQLTGRSLTQWLTDERLARTQMLLENSQLGIESIAAAVGFGSPESLRLHFRRAFGVSPAAWRQLFVAQPVLPDAIIPANQSSPDRSALNTQ